MRLTEEQQNMFHNDGFLLMRNALQDSDVDPVIEEYEAHIDRRANELLAEGKIKDLYVDAPFAKRLALINNQCPEIYTGLDIYLLRGIATFNFLRNKNLIDLVESIVGPEITCNPIQHIRGKLPDGTTVGGDGHVAPWHQDAGVICIEGARYDFPSSEFLESITKAAKKYNIVIISDEITSGWRMTDGGVYKINGFQPDIVVYAKAMGGGFAISAVLGSKEVMDISQDTFMSSTMWTERVGFTAALTTIEILTREKVWEHLIKIGTLIGDGWSRLADDHGLKINVTDFKPLITMKLDYGDRNPALTTLFIQEMLRRRYLASTSVYVSYAHTEKIVDTYLSSVNECFSILADAIENNSEDDLLETKIRSDSFKRITP